MRAIIGVFIMAGLLGTMGGGKAQQPQQAEAQPQAKYYGPPDMSKYPAEFADEMNRYYKLFSEEKITAHRYQKWAQGFFERMSDYKNAQSYQPPGVDLPDAPPPLNMR
jgi:hypothetical protein